MIEDNEGFLYPKINKDKCIHCSKCEKACPVLNPIENQIIENNPPSNVYAAYALDEESRFMSTSGGAFSEFAKRILELGGVCFGAAYEDNFSVRHVCIEKIEDLPRIRQSKYYQSIIGNVYNEVLDNLKKDKYV